MLQLKICTGYKIDGKTINDFPASVTVLEKCRPVYEELPGWQKPTSDVRLFKDLPVNARKYIKRLEELVGCSSSLISVGQRRDQTIVRKSVF
jgi:adenylosuccinate synthase